MRELWWKIRFVKTYCYEYSYTKMDCKVGWRLAEKSLQEYGWAFSPKAACTMKVNEMRAGI